AEGFAVDASLIPADAGKQHAVPSSDRKPEEITEEACRATRQYLATLDDAAFGAATPVTPKFVSLSDPAAQWVPSCRYGVRVGPAAPTFAQAAVRVAGRINLATGRQTHFLLFPA